MKQFKKSVIMDRFCNNNHEVIIIILSINKASELLGVSISTLRRWEKEGKIKSERTKGGHRRYDKNKISYIHMLLEVPPKISKIN